MFTKYKPVLPLFMLLACLLAACGHKTKFVVPQIEPPAGLIPAYVPEGFELVSGFQLGGEIEMPAFSDRAGAGLFGWPAVGDPFVELKSPAGNDIQGVYYQSKQQIIIITESYYPKGTLDLWQSAYETSLPHSCGCESAGPRLEPVLFPLRFFEIQEERTIDGTRVAIAKSPLGWTTVFVRGDYLLTVESGISLEENLKIVASLLGK